MKDAGDKLQKCKGQALLVLLPALTFENTRDPTNCRMLKLGYMIRDASWSLSSS